MDSQIVLGGEHLLAVFALLRLVPGVSGVMCPQLFGRGKFVLALVTLVLLEMRLQMRDHVVDFVGIVTVAVVAFEVHRVTAQYGIMLDPGLCRTVIVVLGMHL